MIDSDSTMKDNGIMEKYCYDNKLENCEIYGGLYQWDELMQYTTVNGAQGICPDGWHVSTWEEWGTLASNYSGNGLKEPGTIHWNTGNSGNNTSGFSALPAGYKLSENGEFEQQETFAAFYTSTKMDPPYFGVWYRGLFYNSSMIDGGNAWETHGFSVRCVID